MTPSPRRLCQSRRTGAAGLVALLFSLSACSAAQVSSGTAAESSIPAVEPVTPTAAATMLSPTPTPTPALPKGAEALEIQPAPDLSTIPELDTSIANVPLSEIVFDTFGRTPARYVALDQASDELILGLRDAITPVYHPVYGGAGDLPWLQDANLVIGYVAGDRAYAYPINILNLHELVVSDGWRSRGWPPYRTTAGIAARHDHGLG